MQAAKKGVVEGKGGEVSSPPILPEKNGEDREVSRESCFYGGAFPQVLHRRSGRVSGDFPQSFCVDPLLGKGGVRCDTSLCVSFDCDFLSEELVGRGRKDWVEVFFVSMGVGLDRRCGYSRRAGGAGLSLIGGDEYNDVSPSSPHVYRSGQCFCQLRGFSTDF